jgi:hypothetical protein
MKTTPLNIKRNLDNPEGPDSKRMKSSEELQQDKKVTEISSKVFNDSLTLPPIQQDSENNVKTNPITPTLPSIKNFLANLNHTPHLSDTVSQDLKGAENNNPSLINLTLNEETHFQIITEKPINSNESINQSLKEPFMIRITKYAVQQLIKNARMKSTYGDKPILSEETKNNLTAKFKDPFTLYNIQAKAIEAFELLFSQINIKDAKIGYDQVKRNLKKMAEKNSQFALLFSKELERLQKSNKNPTFVYNTNQTHTLN